MVHILLFQIDFEFEFSLIYAIYSLPNTFLPFVGGYMADIFGNRVVLMVFGVLVLLGNIIMTAACQWELINVYIFGRFVFGLGLESLGVVAGVIIAKWFLDQELALALGK